ncbi:signal recognition particle-docking protein FtsY [Streptococcus merionis]|uniref:signal recognition particle-docking protein FtsY n=1 Tax=Streptococcus merionis TaxID=400065 RepID=UPI0026EE68B0|nr:signal recognition particle-docking protein FtsY [Streptococcus merionis]
MGLFDRLFGKKKQEETLKEKPLEEASTSAPEMSDWEDITDVAEESFAEEVAQASNETTLKENFEDESFSDQAESAEAFFEREVVENDRQIPFSQDEKETIAEQVPSAEIVTPETQVDFPQEQLVVSDEIADVPTDSITDEVNQKSEQVLSVEETTATIESAQQDIFSEEHVGEGEISLADAENKQPTAETVAHVPSSLERAMEILRDKEKRAAAVEEAEARNAKNERLLQERAEEEARLAEHARQEKAAESTQEKYDRSLKKTRTGFGAKLNAFFANFRTVDEEFFEDLEELLITSDVGVQVATTLTEELRQEAKLENAKKPEDLRRVIIEKLVDIYEQDGNFDTEKINFQDGLTVMLFVGVNGVGKTTSIGKLAHQYKAQGKKVMLVAADTFRAGAVAQLVEWARRVEVDVVTGPEKSDPASVVFDGMERAVAEGVDVLMIDTAGRLQNKDNLMAELEKIGRIIKRVLPEAPHETLLALDASTGQNALVQAKEFSKITPLTGLVLTKIDGTARGGVVLAIRQELDIPVKLIGFGEKIDDIGQFNSEDFMRGLLEGLV